SAKPDMNVYGINSCDQCRKARKWLQQQAIDFGWIDVREQGLQPETVKRWLDRLGAETLVNRRSATWRMMPLDQRPTLHGAGLVDALLAKPTLIKRPLFERDTEVRAGFDERVRQWLKPQ
ncbi:MAG: Spx/MgsR family RNA polymerase-binding regulatory protein, partial [Xanthomonadaceae bacterium]|nr:Spx/MgsR family RNA polymerase-binding regulatory protein [Xanthomonadaceae bacterium]